MGSEILPWASSPSRKWPPGMEWQTLLAGQLYVEISNCSNFLAFLIF